MFQLFEHIAKFTIASGTGSHCDDFVDRLNRKYTIYLLLICCAIISSKQYVGDPLSCFCPSHFTGAHVEYTNNICWISNAYYVPIDDVFSINGVNNNKKELNFNNLLNSNNNNNDNDDDDERPNSPIRVVKVNNLIAYYPFLLLIQAVFFYIPYFLWKNIVNHSAYDINTLINYAKDLQSNEQTTETRERVLKYLIRHIDRASNYYNTKKLLQFHSNDFSSDIGGSGCGGGSGGGGGGDYTTIVTETSKIHLDDDFNEQQPASTLTINKRNKQPISFTHNPNIKFDLTKNKTSSLKSFHYKNNNNNNNGKIDKINKFCRFYILDSLCEKFLFTLYLIIKLFYFTNSFGQLLLLNKMITGDTNSIQKLFSTLSSPFTNGGGGSSSSTNNNANINNDLFNHHKQLLQSIFTITNKNDIFLIQQKYDNNNYFLMAGSNIWTGFEFGYKAIINLIQTGSLFNTHTRLLIFHSVIFCDFKIRVLGDRLHKHTVQCVAPINIFSEKLFTLIWFWFLILSFINAYNLIEWLNFYFFSRIRLNFILNYIYSIFNKNSNSNSNKNELNNCFHKNNQQNSKNIRYKHNKKTPTETTLSFPNEINSNFYNIGSFKSKVNEKISIIKQNLDKNTAKKIIKSYLELDNLFIIRLIAKNTNEVVTQELIIILLDYYQNRNPIVIDTDNNSNDGDGASSSSIVKKTINL